MRVFILSFAGMLLGVSAWAVAAETGSKSSPPSSVALAADDAKAKPAADAEEGAPHTVWMRKKLDYTQEILAGIAVADYDRIAKNASSMRALSRIEGFVRGRTPGYRGQLQIFEEATDELLRQAEKENVDGAALAFTQLTISCVNCHKQLRQAEKK
ncbi:MAG: hypothetical protein U0939_08790 [Pirellulales bacterium]